MLLNMVPTLASVRLSLPPGASVRVDLAVPPELPGMPRAGDGAFEVRLEASVGAGDDDGGGGTGLVAVVPEEGKEGPGLVAGLAAGMLRRWSRGEGVL